MAVNPGEEFRNVATPSREVLRKLVYLAEMGSDSIVSGHADQRGAFGSDRAKRSSDTFYDVAQMLEQQRQHAQRIAEINSRLEVLDQASEQAMREAEKRLDEIMHNANRTNDGRIVFLDKDGTLRDRHGAVVENDQVDWDQWDPAADSWETYQDIQDDYRHAREFHEQVQEQKERLADGDLSDEELDALEKDLTELEKAAPQSTVPSPEPAERSTSAAKSYSGDAKLGTVKSIGPVFASAGQPDTAVPDTEPEPQLSPGTVPLSP